MVMPAILLQKPSRKSTAKQHSEYLTKRLNLWENGEFDQLMLEARSIQHVITRPKPKHDSQDQLSKTFAKFIMENKVHAALRLLDKAESLGIAEMTNETIAALKNLHPEAVEADESVLMDGEIPFFDGVIFTNINESAIASAALKTKGGAGPSGHDANGWRRMIISKNYGKTGKDLRTAIAKMTQLLCTREVRLIENTTKTTIEAFTANRLIPLLKNPSGIRPIGIGEVLRRIIGKAIVTELKDDLIECGGSLQLCTGQKAGCEAAAHAMNEIMAEEGTDGILLVDASNAFNSLNRVSLLHKISLSTPLNIYKKLLWDPSKTFRSRRS